MLEESIARMFDELDEFLAARPRNRLFLVHGYELDRIDVERQRHPFASSLIRERATVSLRLPVVWEVKPRRFPFRASDTPTTEEPDRLRAMLENYVDAGGLNTAGAVELADWQLERPLNAIPSRGTARDAHWTVRVEFVAH